MRLAHRTKIYCGEIVRDRGGFRHVQHVRPNRGLTKRGKWAFHKRTGKFLLRRDADNTVSVCVV